MSYQSTLGKLISSGLGLVIANGKPIVRNILKNEFKKSVIRTAIKLAFTFAGILLVIFSPFGAWWSELVASFIFIGLMVWSGINFITLASKHWRLPVCIVEEMDISSGIVRYVKERWCGANIGISTYDSLRKGKGEFSRHFNNLPPSNEIVREYIRYVIKDIILFVSFFALYMLIMNFLIKPHLLKVYADLTPLEIYLFPFVETFKTISSFFTKS